MKKVLKWLKSLFVKKKDHSALYYYRMKNNYVKFDNGKKQKLRKYLSSLAYRLEELGEKNYVENRELLIKGFNKGGMERLNKDYTREVKRILNKKAV